MLVSGKSAHLGKNKEMGTIQHPNQFNLRSAKTVQRITNCTIKISQNPIAF
jgi:hypothetical protein